MNERCALLIAALAFSGAGWWWQAGICIVLVIAILFTMKRRGEI